MIDRQKEYWFAFEPYIHITRKPECALIYNTLDGNHLIVTDKTVLALLTEMVKPENCGVIQIMPFWKSRSCLTPEGKVLLPPCNHLSLPPLKS